ncbi:SDR family NAD(P)-dependent oxidoreductase [Mitsuaria sp. WAJ17]|uniref:SDR family NAD(P)-dependent oxidoreductase n=1 Tax=Mitsuaria sp. WAJ17 TaxID=2761452 RepID=UPI001601FAAA|nr:SDR family NAD(P)-dependent oxidoreductase [Mitsuaria sp. WAJ17]MBB2485168.1 SDR family NAD(P)-dependent oxidoreductase [Mitsuaria sp. WAJ17]
MMVQTTARPLTLITGANRGLGHHLARLLAAAGSDLLLVCRRPLSPDQRAALQGGGQAVVELACDLRDPQALAAGLRPLLEARPLHCAINNAGVFSQQEELGLSGLAIGDIIDMTSVNATAPAVISALVQDKLQPGGVLVNVLSDMAFPQTWNGSYPLYCATKAFLWALTVNSATALEARGAKVIGLDPGWMKTDMGGDEAPDDPVEVARGLLSLLAAPQRLDNGRVYGLSDFAEASAMAAEA